MVAALAPAGCGSGAEAPQVESKASALVTGAYTFSLPLLKRSSPAEYPVAASTSLKIDTNVKIVSSSLLVQAFSSGAGATSVDIGSKLGTLISQGPVTLRNTVTVSGSVQSAGLVTTGVGDTVSGGITQQTAVGPFGNVTFSADFTGTPPTDTNVLSGTQILSPGHFAGLHVAAGATVVLNPGTYYFTRLTFDSNSTLTLGAGTAPVIIYVADTVIYRGKITGTNLEPRLLVAVAGASPIFIDTTFHGTLVAPNAPLTVGQSNIPQFGAFFGTAVEVASGVTLTHTPFDWLSFLPPTKVTWTDGPVALVGSVSNDGTFHDATSTPATPVTFTIPPAIKVTQGNAGNGTAVLTFTNGSGTNVTCTYKGGSTVPNPIVQTSLVNWALGLSYKLVSCSNGLLAGASTTGRNFKLHVVSGQTLGTKVTAAVQLGGGCTASLDDPFDPVLSAQTSTNFSWTNTQPLPVTDPAGHTSLYYAWIYVENKEQIRGLNIMKADWSAQPLFAVDYDKYKGQCGAIDYAGDGRGLFVYAIIPGTLYNFLRSAALDAVNNAKEMPFRAIVIPNKPNIGDPTIWNTDGSLSWDALKRNKFQYFNGPQGGLRQRQSAWSLGSLISSVGSGIVDVVKGGGQVFGDVVDGAGDFVTGVGGILTGDPLLILNYLGKTTGLWQKAAKIINDAATDITTFFGTVDKFLFGHVNATIDFDIISLDPMFSGTKLIRGWGPRAGMELAPQGATVYVKQWSESILGIFPVSFNGDIDDDGVVTMSIGKNNSSRGSSGVCFTLENSNGMISPDLLATDICDFGDSAAPSSTTDSSERLWISWDRANMLAQVHDGAQYNQQVIGNSPKQVEVATGLVGSAVTAIFNSSNPETLCLGYPSAETTIINALTNVTGAVAGSLMSSMIEKDIFMSDTDGAATPRNSRAVMTHEYGHYTMCSLMVNKSPDSLAILMNRLGDGKADSRDDRIALSFESMADLFASQVAGGTNYVAPYHFDSTGKLLPAAGFALPNGDNIAYCVGSPCVETNFRGVNDSEADPFRDEVARTMTSFVDAFDGANRTRTDLNPGNGDMWASAGGPLTLSPLKYLPIGNKDDENISMPGTAWQTWINHWIDASSIISIDHLMPALSDAMSDTNPNATACDLCDVFALHSNDVRALNASSQSAADRAVRQDICRNQPDVHGFLGSHTVPPMPIDSITCRSCDPDQASVNGTCVTCAPNQIVVNNPGSCFTCLPGSVPNTDHTICVSCGSKQIVVTNACVDCPADQGANRTTNSCVNCPADLAIDWRIETSLCRTQELFTDLAPAAGDVCPDEYWVELDHVQAMVDPVFQKSSSPTEIAVETLASTSPPTQAACSATLAQLDPWVPNPANPGRFLPEGRLTQAGGFSAQAGCLTHVERDWTLAALQSQSNVDTLRFMVSRTPVTVNGATTTVPQEITVTQACFGGQ